MRVFRSAALTYLFGALLAMAFGAFLGSWAAGLAGYLPALLLLTFPE